MQTIEAMQAKHEKELAKLAYELEMAKACPIVPDSVLQFSAKSTGIIYRKRPLVEAIEIFRAYDVVPFYKYKGTYTRFIPSDFANEKDGKQIDGPYACKLHVDQIESNFGPGAKLKFFGVVAAKIVEIWIDIEGPGYIGTWHAVGAKRIESRDHRGRLESAYYRVNAKVSALADCVQQYATGDMGPIKTGANIVYAFCADRDILMSGTEHSHALGQLANLGDL